MPVSQARFKFEELATTDHKRTGLMKEDPQGETGMSNHNNRNLAWNSCYGGWKVNGDSTEFERSVCQ